ncbi:MAG: hypothetical protein U0791_23435 [Gemmataceae bacterium]
MQEKEDNAITVVRIVDNFALELAPDTPADIPSEKHKIPFQIAGLISFKTGDSPGEHTLRLVMESPNGKKRTMLEKLVLLSPQPNGGFNFRMNMTLGVSGGGLFIVHVYLDGRLYTSMPIQITISRAVHSPAIPADLTNSGGGQARQ